MSVEIPRGWPVNTADIVSLAHSVCQKLGHTLAIQWVAHRNNFQGECVECRRAVVVDLLRGAVVWSGGAARIRCNAKAQTGSRVARRREPIPEKGQCKECRTRWRQTVHGLCRGCERRIYGEARTVREIEAQDVARKESADASAQRVEPAPTTGERVVRRSHGVEFEVVWDGR